MRQREIKETKKKIHVLQTKSKSVLTQNAHLNVDYEKSGRGDRVTPRQKDSQTYKQKMCVGLTTTTEK